jgi:hypothetical protein
MGRCLGSIVQFAEELEVPQAFLCGPGAPEIPVLAIGLLEASREGDRRLDEPLPVGLHGMRVLTGMWESI